MKSIDERASEVAVAKAREMNPKGIVSDQRGADGGGSMRPNAPTFDEQKKSGNGIFESDLEKSEPETQDIKIGDEEQQAAPDEVQKSQKAMSAGEDMSADDEGEEGEEMDDEGEDAEKSKKSCKKSGFASVDELQKSLNALEQTAISGEDVNRREELAKSFAEGNLSDEEREEFIELLGVEQSDDDGDVGPNDMGKSDSYAEQFANDDTMAEAYDVSTFIERQSQLVAEAMDSMRGEMNKSATKQSSFNVGLSKSLMLLGNVLADQSAMIKSQQETITALNDRLTTVENQPMPQRGVTNPAQAQGMRKGGFVPRGGNQQPQQLSKSDVFNGLDQLMQKSMASGSYRLGEIPLAPCGEPLTTAAAKFETSGKISPALYQDVKNVLGAR